MKDLNKELPQNIPEGYFDRLADRIMNGVAAANDVSGGQAPSYGKEMPYVYEISYFEQLSNRVMSRILAEEQLPVLLKEQYGTSLPYTRPEGYFDQLPAALIYRINATDEDLVDISGINELKQADTYQVPQGYFTTLTLNKEKEGKEENRKKLHPATRAIKWMNWAAAACILLIFSVGAYWMIPGKEASASPEQLASLQLNEISDQAINKYLQEDFENYDVYTSLENNIKKNESGLLEDMSKRILNNVSQDDINEYLEKEGI